MGVDTIPRTIPSTADARAIRVAARIPSVLQAGLCLFGVKVALAIFGFDRTVRWVRRRTELVEQHDTMPPEAIKAVEFAVALSGGLYVGRALCLEQSLVLYYLLRRRGVPVAYCQGAQAHPFSAHAWVEYRGTPLNDIAEHTKQFARLPGVLP